MEEKIFDIRGQICPSTLLTAMKEVNIYKDKLKQEEFALVFLTDNRDAVTTIPSTIGNMGYQVVFKKDEGFYTITISRKK